MNHANETGISSGRLGLSLVCTFTYLLCTVKIKDDDEISEGDDDDDDDDIVSL